MANDIATALAALDQQQTANPFWQEQLRAPDLGYRCAPLLHRSNRDDPHIRRASEVAARIRVLRDESEALRLSLGKAETPVHILWMQEVGALDEVLDFFDAHRLRWNSGAARWYLYARRLMELTNRYFDRPAAILEVGAGAGELAWIAHALRPWRRWVVVDLPPMLANLYRNLSERMPSVTFSLNEWPADVSDGPEIILLDPENAGLAQERSVDFGLNFNSFMEMDEGVRDGYIALIYRTLRPGGIFWNVNRRQPKMTRLDGTTFDNHPLLYPYRADDRVIEFDLDWSQQDVRCSIGRSYRRMPISRIAQVSGL